MSTTERLTLPDIVPSYRLTHDAVSKIIAASAKKAAEIGSPSGIGVVDAGGRLRGWLLMDGATPLSLDAVLKKCRSAVFTGRPSGGVPAEVALSLALAIPDFANLQGGFPIIKDGETVGAVAAGGGTHEADSVIAEAGLSAIKLD
jgi:uncharacterized protein GlcG (DUF336 family)